MNENFDYTAIVNNIDHSIEVAKLIEKIKIIDSRIEKSENRTELLLTNIRGANSSHAELKKSTNKGSFFNAYDTTKLFEMIEISGNASFATFESISEILKCNSLNIKDLSEMISVLTVLSCLSFKNIKETTDELEEISSSLLKNSNQVSSHTEQINRIIISQIKRFSLENARLQEFDELKTHINDLTRKKNHGLIMSLFAIVISSISLLVFILNSF